MKSFLFVLVALFAFRSSPVFSAQETTFCGTVTEKKHLTLSYYTFDRSIFGNSGSSIFIPINRETIAFFPENHRSKKGCFVGTYAAGAIGRMFLVYRIDPYVHQYR